jgi:DNA-binding MarR family transcriptional regulator
MKKIDHPIQFYLKNIVHAIKLSLDTRLESYDLSSQQAKIVGFIGKKQEAGASICQKDIETVMGITAASITSLLQGLERKGFIQRTTGTTDERVKELSLTPKGKELIDTFNGIFTDTEKKLVQGMTAEEKDLFLNLLIFINKKF